MGKYYVYVYLDPRKKGVFIYEDYKFDFEPFYVGKGKRNRLKAHINEAKNSKKNSHKLNKIRKIINSDLLPIIEKIDSNLDNSKANELEKNLIKLIGRYDKNEGVLTNMIDGGEGAVNFIQTDETKKKRINSLFKSSFLKTIHFEEYRKKLSEIVKEKMKDPIIRKKLSESQKGNKNSMYGKKTSEKQKEAVRKAHKEGKIKLSEEGRNKIIEHNKNVDRSNFKKRGDGIIYKLISPLKEEYEIIGNIKLQKFCSEHKIQFHTLKNNIDILINKNLLNKKLTPTAKNTLGWFISRDTSNNNWKKGN